MASQRIFIAAVFLLILQHSPLGAQTLIPLYDGVVPNSRAASNAKDSTDPSGLVRRVIHPSLEVFLPEKDKANGTAVIICPGGSYKVIVYNGEGAGTAKEFAKRGVTAFVLKYRLPDDAFVLNKTIAPMQDLQQAIKLVREQATKWAVDPARIGVIGFSAGGHLAASAGTHFNESLTENKNHTSLRPDFLVVVYPVISMQDSLTHADSRRNLLGEHPAADSILFFSNEKQVRSGMPPVYITHAADDKLVDVDNSISFFEALRKQQVPVEMHIYPKGGHGFIFRQPGWIEPLFAWMQTNKWMP